MSEQHAAISLNPYPRPTMSRRPVSMQRTYHSPPPPLLPHTTYAAPAPTPAPATALSVSPSNMRNRANTPLKPTTPPSQKTAPRTALTVRARWVGASGPSKTGPSSIMWPSWTTEASVATALDSVAISNNTDQNQF